MNNDGVNVSSTIKLNLKPQIAFDTTVAELKLALAELGINFESGAGGKITEGDFEAGIVSVWEPGKRIELKWRQASWQPEEETEIEIRFDGIDSGTKLIIEHRNWGKLLGGGDEIAGWFASEIAAPFLRSAAPVRLGDWITDRRARRPFGAQSSSFYRDPLYHYPNFKVILQELALTSADYFLDVGCGGGAMIKEALKSGCRAAGIDHSLEMVGLAGSENKDSVAEGRLKVIKAGAENIPFPDGTFTCAAMTGVLGFLSDPVAAMKEIRRVLCTGGRFVQLGSDPKMKGTPAAPEPMASRLHFYEDNELADLARKAGFDFVEVVRRDLGPFAKEVGVPEEHLPLFSGSMTPFLIAKKK